MVLKKNEKNEVTFQQKEVIESSVGVKRVIACAGSGKTFVLTQSIIELLENQACKPDEILAITFTRNAAENMRQNIRDKLSKDIDFEAINIYTFNSFGNLIVSENSFALELGKDYRLINTSKSWQILFEIVKYANLENIVVGKDTGKFIEQILKYINSLKSNLISAEELDQYYENRDTVLLRYLSEALKREEKAIFEYLNDVAVIYKKYEEVKIQNNFIDYNDHVFLPYKLMLHRKDLLEKYRSRYKYIFIDEFQDTDVAQGRLISLLFKPGYNSLMIVGDDDQGIYSFRGACVENILNFSNWDVFSGTDIKDFYLTTNFRSGRNIIKAINNVISRNECRFAKDFKPDEKAGHSEVMFFSEETHTAECKEIASNIKLLQKQGIKLRDMAVLSRIKRFDSICEALDRNGLKYELVSGRGFFYEPEILFIISWLMILSDINDDVYLVYLLQSQKYRISDRDIFFLTFSEKNKSRNRLADGLLDYKNNIFLSNSAKIRIREFLDELDYYMKQSSYLKLAELIALIFKRSGLFD
jgi:DNA helicase-2/ATP-dependent DNA helicase PcrA